MLYSTGVSLFEDLLDSRYFILKTDHKNLTYINVTFTGKVLRWKLYLQDKDFDLYHVPGKEEHQFVPDALSRLCVNNIPPPPTLVEQSIVALVTKRLKKVHNSKVGHWGLDICRRRLSEEHPRRGERGVTDRMIKEFIRQCPACQVMNRMRLQIKTHRFTCASYNPFEVLNLDHIGPLTKDAHGKMGGAVPYEVDDRDRDCFHHPESHWPIRYSRSHPYRPRPSFS